MGKSSLLEAGLLPRLADRHWPRYQRRDHAAELTGTLRAMLADIAAEAGAAISPDASIAQKWLAIEQQTGKPVTLILDQAEECFTRDNRGERGKAEIEQLLVALDELFAAPARWPQGRLILGFRKEYLAEFRDRITARKLGFNPLFLERLDRDGILEVVQGPTSSPDLQRKYGLRIADPDLPEMIADDLLLDPESPIAVTLQVLLSRMWDAATAKDPDHPVFDQALYAALHREGRALGDFLDQQIKKLAITHAAAVASGLALDILTDHTSDLGTARERSVAELEHDYQHQAALLTGLLQQTRELHLLVDPRPNQPTRPRANRLAHDTLAPLVRDRFNKSEAPGQRARRILENRTREAQPESRDKILLSPLELRLVKQGAQGMPTWSSEQRALIGRSQRRASLIELARWLALLLLLVLAAIPVRQQVRNYLLRKAADRPRVSFPAATVKLGDSEPGNRRVYPSREVFVDAYFIDTYEVSYAQYRLCVKAGFCSHPREPANTKGFDDYEAADDNLPVVWVDAFQAAAFCQWMGRRLPTEAEWERAVRGDHYRRFPWGDDSLPDPTRC